MSDVSLLISKTERDGKTYTSVKTLTEEEKIMEIVRIIGGRDSDIARRHAEEMIASANEFKINMSKS